LCAKKAAPKEDNDTLFFKPAHKPELLGAKECTYGPSYWCASRENAAKCHVSLARYFKNIIVTVV